MKRNHAAVLALLAAAIAAVVVLNLPRGGRPAPLEPTIAALDAGTAGDRSGRLQDDRPDAAPVAATRTELTPKPATLDLHPSVRAALTGFTGRIVDPLGAPVPESLVRLYRFAPDALFRPNVSMFLDGTVNEPQIEAGESRTGADGRFTIDGVFPRAVFLLHADADGDAPTWRVVQRAAPPGELVDIGDVQLLPCGILTGTVHDQDGNPIAGALVRAVDVPGTFLSFAPLERFDPDGGLIVSEEGGLAFPCPAWVRRRFDQLPIPQTRTDSQGAFRLTGVAPGGNLVATTARGHMSNVRPRVVVDPGEEKDLGKLVLQDGEYAYGKVVDDEDRPIAGAQVLVAARTMTFPVHFASFAEPTNEEGIFELGGFPPGEVLVAARRDRGEPWVVTEAQPVTKDLVVKLPSVRTLTLEIVDASGDAIDDPRLQLTPGSPDEGSLEQAMWGVTSPLDLTRKRSRDEDGRIVIQDLPKGKYTLLAATEQHATTALAIDVTERSQELRVELRPKLRFTVRAVDPQGAPVAGAAVYARAEGARPRVPEAPIHVGTTGENGELVVDQVSATEVAVTASHPAFGNADTESPLPPPGVIVLKFASPGEISGVVAEGGTPPELGKWMVYVFPRGGPDGAFPDMPQLTAPDAEGRFRVGGLRPGRYSVGIQSSLDVVSSAGKIGEIVANAFLQPELPREQVEIAAGARVEVVLDTEVARRIDGPVGTIRGTVLVDGRLGTGYVVQGYGPRRIVAEVDEAGMFDFGPVPVGDYRLQLTERPSGDLFSMRRSFGASLWSKGVKVEEGKEVVADIDVSIGRIEGIVFAKDGSPGAGVMISAAGVTKDADGSERNIHLNTIADAEGRFEFEKAPTGTYRIAAHDRDARGHVSGIEVVGGGLVPGVRVQLVATVVVRCSIDLAALRKPDDENRRTPYAMLLATDDGRTGTGWSGIADDGTFEFDDVSPGTYKVRILNTSHGTMEHDGLLTVGTSNVEGFVVRPIVPEPEAVPEQAVRGRRN